MLSKPYRGDFVYTDSNTLKSVYDLIILPETDGRIIVILTLLVGGYSHSIADYDRIATQVYYQHLQKTEINKIIWIKKVIQKTTEEEFFEVDLIWEEEAKFFHSPEWEPCDPQIIESIKTVCEEYVG